MERKPTMNRNTDNNPPRSRVRLSLDVWAVTTALVLALLVRTGVLKHIPW
jgi:hypothetical protein